MDRGISEDAASAGSEYEVFLSFRGSDTRASFTSHLYTKLIDNGIRVYKDSEELRVGKEIGPELLKAIKQSKIAMPILSEDYATSEWCLNELVQIMECNRHGNLKVMPVFYHISPSAVRNQTGRYKNAFDFHEKDRDGKPIGDWKRALTEVGQLKGWDLQRETKVEEAKLVKEITEQVWDELKKVRLFINEDLVGHEGLVEEILSEIDAKRNGLRVLGIYGMSGIGKTTLARFICSRVSSQFDSCSFVADIRENFETKGKQFLLKTLISNILRIELQDNDGFNDEGLRIISERFHNKKVLILLDDVDKIFQIDWLIEKPEWFASGSLIIITTWNRWVLEGVDVDWMHELPYMDHQFAQQLFIKQAFQNNEPPKGYRDLIEKAVEICGGLPLSLVMAGSSLRKKSYDYWQRMLEKLKEVPLDNVEQRLNISFDTLHERQQHILLDIACFFIGVDYRMAIHFWDGLELHPEVAIDELHQKSFIKIEADKKIRMHGQMRDFCREYIKKGRVSVPEKQRVLWDQEVARRILKEKMVAESVEGLFLQFDMQSQLLYTAEDFVKLPNLKFLQVEGNDISQALSLFERGLRTIPKLFSLLQRSPLTLSKLRWVCWHHFLPMYELNNFVFKNLVFLDLSESNISDDWDRRSNIKIAERLKVLNLSGCEKLTKTPNFSKNILLEQLIMERCTSLTEIDSSIGMLKSLLIISLRDCTSLRKLPTEFGGLESLDELILDNTSLLEFPEFIGNLKHLSLLSLRNCGSIHTHPKSYTGLESVVQLDLSESKVVELPDSLGDMKNLKVLNVDGCKIRELPTSIGMLERLKVISADECHCLESIPNLPHSLLSLTVRSEARRMKTIPDFSNLTSLEHLIVYFADVPSHPPEMETRWNLGKLSQLVDLKVRLPHIQELHGELGKLSCLKELVLEKCHSLQSIPKLPSSLMMLRVNDCGMLKSLPDLSHLKKLRDLHIGRTPILEVEGLQMLTSLRKLVLDRCGIQALPDMSNLKGLKVLEVTNCPDLVEIQGKSLESLEEIHLFECISLEIMPDILNKEKMKRFSVANCGNIFPIEVKDPKTTELEKAINDVIEKFLLKDYQMDDELEKAINDVMEKFLLKDYQMDDALEEDAHALEEGAEEEGAEEEDAEEEDADKNLSQGFKCSPNPSIILLLLVLTLSAPKFLGFEFYRLSWLGIFLCLILLFAKAAFDFMEAPRTEDADRNPSEFEINLNLPINPIFPFLVLLAPKLLGLEPYRLFWYLWGVFLKICS